jgi:hypothetical protein
VIGGLAINIFSHVLNLTIESWMIVLCKKYPEKSQILFGEICFIGTTAYQMMKRFKKSEKRRHAIAASDNRNSYRYETTISIDSWNFRLRRFYIMKNDTFLNCFKVD